jgi:hypothetical protein
MLIKYLDKDTAIKELNEYQQIIGGEIGIGKEIKETSQDLNESFTGRIFIEHILSTLNSYRKTISQLIKTIETEPEWSAARVPWWREEVEGRKTVRSNRKSISNLSKTAT